MCQPFAVAIGRIFRGIGALATIVGVAVHQVRYRWCLDPRGGLEGGTDVKRSGGSNVHRGMDHRSLAAFALSGLVLGACATHRSEHREVVLAPPWKGTALVVAAAPPKARPNETKACFPPGTRDLHLTAAWLERGRAHYCLEPDSDEGETDPALRSCWSTGPGGDLRREVYRIVPSPHLSTEPFRRESADGKLTFRLEGGLLSPKKAVGVLEQKSPRKVLKRAPIDYDEHLAFDGFVGSAIVLRSWVDEGPGCTLTLVDPRKTWPSGMNLENGTHLGSCYGGTHLLRTRADEVAVLDAGGSGLVFVNEGDLTTTELDLERQAGPEMGTPFVGFREGQTLMLVYGAPIAGDVVRVDLGEKRVVSAHSPSPCEPAQKTEPPAGEPEVDF